MTIPKMAWRTQINHIVASERLLSLRFNIQIIWRYIFFLFSYSNSDAFINIRDFLERHQLCDAYVEFREGAFLRAEWMKRTFHVLIALNNGQSIQFWVKIWKRIPLSKRFLCRHKINLAFPV